MARSKVINKPESTRLERVVLERGASGWTVTRQRKERGESMGPFDMLSEALECVTCLYDDRGEELPRCQECLEPIKGRHNCDFAEVGG